jgi:glycosyltransferase involved in cell wall biosynthesis
MPHGCNAPLVNSHVSCGPWPHNAVVPGKEGSLIRRHPRFPRAPDPLRFLLRIADGAPRFLRGPLGRTLVAASRDAGSGRTGSFSAISHAVGLQALGHDGAARAFAVRAAASNGPATRLAMARFLDALGADADTLDVLSTGRLPRDPEAARAWRELQARKARRLGRYRDAVAAIDDALRLAPDDPVLRKRRRTLATILERFDGLADHPGHKRLARTADRVAWLTYQGLPSVQSGYTLRTQQSAMAQRAAGLDPHVVVLQGAAATEGGMLQSAVDGVPYQRLPGTWRLGRAGTARGHDAVELAAAALERLEPAAIQATTPFVVGRTGLALARRFGLPLVYEVRGFIDEAWLASVGESGNDADHYVLTRHAEAACMVEADAVVTLGEAMKTEIVARGVPAERITVVPNVVDSECFAPGPRDGQLALDLRIAADELVVGYISSFQPYEDFETFLRAIEQLHARGRRVRGLWVGGKGQKLAAARQRVSAAGLEGCVLLPGGVPHTSVARYHRLIDIFVVPRAQSRVGRLVTPLKPFEAMASGRPIVVSRLDALMEFVAEGETGLSYEAGNAGDLADVLDRLLAEPELRACLGRAARAWVVANRTMQQMGERYLALYQRLGVATR